MATLRHQPPPLTPLHSRGPSVTTAASPVSPLPTLSLTSTRDSISTDATSIAPEFHDANVKDFQHSFSPFSLEGSNHDVETWFHDVRSPSEVALSSSDDCPNSTILDAIADIPVFSADGSARPFSSLYSPDDGATHPRQLIVFVRHFYCGACQAYLTALADGIPPRDYFAIPVPTNIIVIGCGAPHLIPHYKNFANCPFPVFADPSRRLFKRLGMIITAKTGRVRPEYMADISKADWMKGQVTTIRNSLRDPEGIRKRDIIRGGNPMQTGGEFLFEDGQIVWCHRMRNYRDHTEVRDIRRLLELDDD